jgi:hypothetical protein
VIVRTACGYYYQYWFALDEDEMLEDNDLKLIEKNTGETFAHSKNKLTCLRCGSNSRSPPVASISRLVLPQLDLASSVTWAVFGK